MIRSGNINYNDKYEKRYHKKMILESKLVQTFKNKDKFYYHYLNPKTPRYHANMLFNQMIDYCKYNNMALSNYILTIGISAIIKQFYINIIVVYQYY